MEAVAEGRNPAPDSLWRRYSEFEVLRSYLLVTYPAIVVSPLPEKRVRRHPEIWEFRDRVHVLCSGRVCVFM